MKMGFFGGLQKGISGNIALMMREIVGFGVVVVVVRWVWLEDI